MRCDECKHWLVAVDVAYEDGTVIDQGKVVIGTKVVQLHRHPEGRGQCEKLNMETAREFFCAGFEPQDWDHTEHYEKSGAPWQHWQILTCPDCNGIGLGCMRCVGTGKVRHYDDGYIGEERTRLHPKQKEAMAAGPPKCVSCEKDLDPNWVSCPWCGTRTNKMGEREVIPYVQGAVQGTTDELMGKMIAARRARQTEQGGEVLNAGGTQ
jgi:hypothetical protein